MSEEQDRPMDAESILLEKIGNSIQTDGFPDEVVRDYLQNERVSIPGLKLKMVEMLRTVPEAYAACYFEILADIQVQCEDGLIPKSTVADLSQVSMQAVRNMAASFYPVQKLRDLIRETGEATGHVPKPYALHQELYGWLEEANKRAEAAEKRRSTQEKAWKKEASEQYTILSEQLSGLTERGIQTRDMLKEQEQRLKELQRQVKEQGSLTGTGSTGTDRSVKEAGHTPAGIFSFIRGFFTRENRQEAEAPDSMKGLLTELKGQGASPQLMREVREAVRQGVPMEEIRFCIREIREGEDGEETAMEALRLYAVRQEQYNRKKEEQA